MQTALEKLGEAVKLKRSSLRPADVGLPQLSERRHGLTQQEVAVLSGVSVRWQAALENGRYRGDAVALARVMATLQFSAEEKDQLLRLAGWLPESWQEMPSDQAEKVLQQMLDGLDHPAYVTDHLWERVCWNKAAARLFSHWLGNQGRYTNLIDYLLLDPHSRVFISDWNKHAGPWLGRFLDHIRFYQNDDEVTSFVTRRRCQSPFFDKLCRQHPYDGVGQADWLYTFQTAKGDKTFSRLEFPVNGTPGQHLTVWLPQS